MLELLIVMAILLVVSAAAVPNIMRVLAQIRVRSGADTIAGLMQQLRQQAVRDNKFYSGTSQVVGSTILACVDLNYNGTCQATEPSVSLAGSMNWAAAPPSTALITCGPLGPSACPAGWTLGLNYIPEPQTVRPSYSARGLPCVNQANPAVPPNWNANNRCVQTDPVTTAPVGFLYVLQYTGTTGISYSAIAVTPAGRVTTWTYTGIDANGNAAWAR